MLRQTGTECASALRARGYKNTIVAITGNTLEEELLDFARAGADLVLGKPLEQAQLQVLLGHLLQHGPASQPGVKLRLQKNAVEVVPEGSYFRSG